MPSNPKSVAALHNKLDALAERLSEMEEKQYRTQDDHNFILHRLDMVLETMRGMRDMTGFINKIRKAMEPEIVQGDSIVLLTSYAPEHKIPAIKAVRAHTGMDLRASKQTVESAPVTINTYSASAAEALTRELRECGCAAHHQNGS